MAWRSQETYFQMNQRMKKGTTEGHQEGPAGMKNYGSDVDVMQGLPQKFINKEGEIDGRLMTGEEAVRYMRGLGMNVPMMVPTIDRLPRTREDLPTIDELDIKP
jgi:hypothetical protein